jgi:hypothetical protein
VRGDESEGDRSPAKQTPATSAGPGPSAANVSVIPDVCLRENIRTKEGAPQHEVGSLHAANPTGLPQTMRFCQRRARGSAMEKEAAPTQSAEALDPRHNVRWALQTAVNLDTEARESVRGKRGRSPQEDRSKRKEARPHSSQDETKARKRSRSGRQNVSRAAATEDPLNTSSSSQGLPALAGLGTVSTTPETRSAVVQERSRPLAPPTQRQQVLCASDGGEEVEQSGSAAAKELLCAVLTETDLNRMLKFPMWEIRLGELLGKEGGATIATQLDRVVGLLSSVRERLEVAGLTLDQCVQWIIRAVECLPGSVDSKALQVPCDMPNAACICPRV